MSRRLPAGAGGDRRATAPPDRNGAPMNTRTIAIAALVIAVILLIIFVF